LLLLLLLLSSQLTCRPLLLLVWLRRPNNSRPVLRLSWCCPCIIIVTVLKIEDDWRVVIIWQLCHIPDGETAAVVSGHACSSGSPAGSNIPATA
jgi:hypothetical protein